MTSKSIIRSKRALRKFIEQEQPKSFLYHLHRLSAESAYAFVDKTRFRIHQENWDYVELLRIQKGHANLGAFSKDTKRIMPIHRLLFYVDRCYSLYKENKISDLKELRASYYVDTPYSSYKDTKISSLDNKMLLSFEELRATFY